MQNFALVFLLFCTWFFFCI